MGADHDFLCALRDDVGRYARYTGTGGRPPDRPAQEDETPNIAFLIGKESAVMASGNDAVVRLSSAPAEVQKIHKNDDAVLAGEVLTLALHEGTEARRRQIF